MVHLDSFISNISIKNYMIRRLLNGNDKYKNLHVMLCLIVAEMYHRIKKHILERCFNCV